MLNTAADVYARSELAAPQRFTVMETDDGYAVWDDIQDGIHVEPDGVSEEFTSEWEAETYRQQLIEKVQEREAKDWLYVEQSKQNLQQDIPFSDVEIRRSTGIGSRRDRSSGAGNAGTRQRTFQRVRLCTG